MTRILVVDDEPVVRDLVSELLRRAGFDVVSAGSGQEALAVVAADGDLALVVSDLMMPGPTGAELVEAMRAARPGLAVLIMTGTGDELPDDISAGGVGVLGKPFAAGELLNAVRSLLPPPRMRVLVVEDHTAVRESLVAFFTAQEDFEVVGAAANGLEAVTLTAQLAPDIVLMDIRMPVLDGIEATRLVKLDRPETRVVLLSAYEQDELIQAGERAGAESFMLKGVPAAELVSAMRGLAA